jgi:hypothetical protein
MTNITQRIFIDPTAQQPPTRDLPRAVVLPDTLPAPKATKYHPTDGGNENGSVFFVGNATVIMFVDMVSIGEENANCYREWAGIRIMTDVSGYPNI